MRHEIGRGATVLAQQLLQPGEPVFDLCEAFGVGLDDLGVAAERAGHVRELGASVLHRSRERREVGVHGSDALHLGGEAAQLIADGALPFVEPLGRAARDRAKALGVAQPRALLLQLGLLVRVGIELLDFAKLEREEVFSLGASTFLRARVHDLASHRRQRIHLLAEPRALVAELAEGIEVLEVRRRIGQRDRLVLRGDVAEIRRQLEELRGRAETPVEERAAAPLGLDDAAHHELTVEGNPRRLELRGDTRATFNLEQRLHLGLARPAADHVRTRPPAEHQGERIDEHRLARARLSGENVEAGAGLEGGFLNENEVLNGQLQQHSHGIPQIRSGVQGPVSGSPRSAAPR